MMYYKPDDTPVPYRKTAYCVCTGKIGVQEQVPTMAAVVPALLTIDAENDPDANPIKVLYHIMTSDRFGMGYPPDIFDGDPETEDCSWYTAAAFCDETISFEDSEGDNFTEPRFRYSNVFDAKMKGFDLVSDILQSCRGILSFTEGVLKVKIMAAEDTALYHFADWVKEDYFSFGSDSTHIIGTFSNYEEGFFNGDTVTYTIDNISYFGYILRHEDDLLTMCEALELPPPLGTPISIIKSNIKPKTFNYKRRARNDISNVMRVEFINRADDWRWDVVEVEDCADGYWDQDYTTYNFSSFRDKTVRMSGIKRKSQAYRMASFFMDYNQQVLYSCEFETDHIGFMFSVGDVIGITHQITKWQGKMFRIIKLEETDDGNVKFACEEHLPSVYNDYTPAFKNTGGGGSNIYSRPDHVERLHLAQSYSEMKIFVFFSKPTDYPYFKEALIYKKLGELGEFEYEARIDRESSSVQLYTGGIDELVTDIPFDPETIKGTFPNSGYICIENEFIHYSGIDDEINSFTGCARAQLGSTAVAHSVSNYIYYFDESGGLLDTPYLESAQVESDIIQYIKAVAYSSFGFSAISSTAPVENITPVF